MEGRASVAGLRHNLPDYPPQFLVGAGRHVQVNRFLRCRFRWKRLCNGHSHSQGWLKLRLQVPDQPVPLLVARHTQDDGALLFAGKGQRQRRLTGAEGTGAGKL